MKWRLGFDLGTNSIGWSAIELDESKNPISLVDAGVRIFSDGRNPKDRQSLAVARRLPRQARKNRDRYLKRRQRFMDQLIEFGLMPVDEAARKALEATDPWALRVRGLDEKLSKHQLGRALFHLQQRRGFKSNRKTDKGADNESGKIDSASKAVLEKMENTSARTLGEYLAKERINDPKKAHKKTVRARLHGEGAKAFYDFYPTRDMIIHEFKALWSKQKALHKSELPDKAHDALLDTLTFQRDLKPQPVGKCTLNPLEERAPKALPSVQRRRIYEEINHLRIREVGEADRPLRLDERDLLMQKALTTSKVTFDAMRKALKLGEYARFNLESERRKHIDGDLVAAALAAKKAWGPQWRDLSPEQQECVVEKLLHSEKEDELVNWLMAEFGLPSDTARAVSAANLPDGHSNLGRTANAKILAELEKGIVTYDQAVEKAGYHSHSRLDFEGDGEVFDKLPYYGMILERHVAFGSGDPTDILEKRYGKIANPTVHVVLNQVRKVVNDLISHYGTPEQIVVELARDLPLSAKGRSELESTQNKNKKANDARNEELVKLGCSTTYENRLRLRLWEELNAQDVKDRRCPYTGEVISIDRLFSDQVEIEHILPFSKTLDDSVANKTLSMREANRDKGQRTPFEAFSNWPKYDWSMISARAANLPNNKSWRFGPDAMERYNNSERDFLDRQLGDTRYLSRLATTYLKRTGADVWVIPGRMTSDLRWAWGLNSILGGHNQDEAVDPSKNRNNHCHHAIDAVVVGLTDRSLLQAIAREAAKAEKVFDKRLLAGVPEPWPNFRETVKAKIDQIIVSHKVDHGVQGALHNDTAYGIISTDEKQGVSDVVRRVPLASFKKRDNLHDVRDPVTREKLLRATEGVPEKEFTAALVRAGESMSPPIRKVRIVERLKVIPIQDKTGRNYKAYKGDGNYCYDIFVNEKGKWTGEVISRFEANHKDFDPASKASRNGTPLVMRIRGGDMLSLQQDGQPKVMRVVKFSKGAIVLADHHEAGALKSRDADKDDLFKYLNASPSKLQTLRARLVHVSPSGKVYDSGPPPS